MAIVKKITEVEEAILRNLLQAYEAEFSPITKKFPSSSGLYKLDSDISQTDNFLLMEDELPVGFCVKGEDQGRHDIFEFYVVPNLRGDGLGEWFAHQIFTQYKGGWQVRQIEGADAAIGFWRKAIGSFTEGDYQEVVSHDEYWGVVTKQTFMVI